MKLCIIAVAHFFASTLMGVDFEVSSLTPINLNKATIWNAKRAQLQARVVEAKAHNEGESSIVSAEFFLVTKRCYMLVDLVDKYNGGGLPTVQKSYLCVAIGEREGDVLKKIQLKNIPIDADTAVSLQVAAGYLVSKTSGKSSVDQISDDEPLVAFTLSSSFSGCSSRFHKSSDIALVVRSVFEIAFNADSDELSDILMERRLALKPVMVEAKHALKNGTTFTVPGLAEARDMLKSEQLFDWSGLVDRDGNILLPWYRVAKE